MPLSVATLRRLRRGLLAIVALGSTVLAVVLVVHALSPNQLGLAPTPQLVAILALLTLPACTIGAWAWDRSLRKRLAHHGQPESDSEEFISYERAREHPAGRTMPHRTPGRDDQTIETHTFAR